MTSISERLQAVKSRLRQAETEAGRAPESVALIAVSKTQPADAIREAHAAGQRAFGENYLQEALEKMAALADLPLEWHFIGPIQSNKTRPIAENFTWVHGIDRLKIAQRLSDARPTGLPPLNICIEVNVSGEESKGGLEPNDVQALADAIAQLPGLKLRGLMAIPAPTNDIALQRQQFRMLRELLESLKQRGLALDTLSMGMSEDFPAAIAEGATLVRIGTAIFGPRQKRPSDL
jgi:pyridoxal phosphate enzyme (YggS family)